MGRPQILTSEGRETRMIEHAPVMFLSGLAVAARCRSYITNAWSS